MNKSLPQVCIQGLGFVGAAMAVAVASARSATGEPIYEVIGVDQDNEIGRKRAGMLGRGQFPFQTTDQLLVNTLSECHALGNLKTTVDDDVYQSADIVVIDLPLDIAFNDDVSTFELASFEAAFRSVASRVARGSLILVETTVPPGTCAQVLQPILSEELKARGLADTDAYLAHSFERVMPGAQYLESITHFWRVYAGCTDQAADACEEFLSSIIDTKQYPLTRLSSTTASETAKVMENAYRATNIAFIDEWTKFSEAVGIDLFEVTDAIRVRPTHSNIRFPGLGVGGYCLTKDPAFAPAASRQILDSSHLEFPMSMMSVKINQEMPLHAVDRLRQLFDGDLDQKRVLMLGVSYRPGVGDTRYSPAEAFARALIEGGAQVEAYDPFVSDWPEMNMQLCRKMPSPKTFDAIAFTTGHDVFQGLDLVSWLHGFQPMILDTVNVISKLQRERCRELGVKVESIGRGKGL